MLEIRETGIVYRNPRPWLRAIHAWHPSLAVLDSGEWVCGFDLGEAAESLNYRTYLARSSNAGADWSTPVRMLEDLPQRVSTHTLRISRLRNNSLVAWGARFFRDNPEEGLTNRNNLGFVPMELLLLRSSDGGHHWTSPQIVQPPLRGPAFEICHAIVELSDGRWLAPTQTWPNWDGDQPHGMRAIALVSHDQGDTWPESIDIFDRWSEGINHFEVSVCEHPPRSLLSIAWAFRLATGETLPTPYTVAPDGHHFSPRGLTGLYGQTAKLLPLQDGRILTAYRRVDQSGLWGNLSIVDHGEWRNLDTVCLWRGHAAGMAPGQNPNNELAALKFGFPSLVQLPDGDPVLVFWCQEEGLLVIRWIRLRLS